MDLKTSLVKYKEIDSEIQRLTELLNTQKQQLETVSETIVNVIKSPEYATFKKLGTQEHGDIVKITRPGGVKPWSLPKSKLKELIETFYQGDEFKSKAIFEYIVTNNVQQITDFKLSRV